MSITERNYQIWSGIKGTWIILKKVNKSKERNCCNFKNTASDGFVVLFESLLGFDTARYIKRKNK